MTLYLPDTNVWIRELNAAPSRVKTRLRAYRSEDILLCDVVKAELFYGAFKSKRSADNLVALATLFGGFESLPFDGEAARVFGKLRADLAVRGTPIGLLDLQIASIALVHCCIMVTNNTREFSRIVGLKVEDWDS